MRTTFYSLFIVCFVVFIAQKTDAQIYRGKTVYVVVGFPAGGIIDQIARPLAQRLIGETGGVFIVNNRPGATGIIANESVARAKPDGYTLLVAPSSSIASVPHMRVKMPYDALADLVPVVQVATYPSVLISHPSVPGTTVRDLIPIAKKKPNLLTFGSAGIGSTFHLSGELVKQMAKVEMLHVPYNGIAPALIDLLGGRIDLLFATYQVVRPFIGTGKIRIIAVTSRARDPLLLEVPTISESGLPGYEASNWIGMFVPKTTPEQVVSYLNGTIQDILTTPEMRALWKAQGVQFSPNTPIGFANIVSDAYDRYGKLIATIGIKPE